MWHTTCWHTTTSRNAAGPHGTTTRHDDQTLIFEFCKGVDPPEHPPQTSNHRGWFFVICSFGKTCPPAGYHVFARLEYLLISLIKYECQANFSKRALKGGSFFISFHFQNGQTSNFARLDNFHILFS